MERILALLLAGLAAFGADLSYVALNDPLGGRGLARVSEDGKLIQSISPKVSGYGLAIDRNGDYIVAAITGLLRVTRVGDVSIIATAPAGTHWLKVTMDGRGDFILCDNKQHAIWRVGRSGTPELVAHYPEPIPRSLNNLDLTVDSSGNYLVVSESVRETSFSRITPDGQVEAIALRGDRIPRGGTILPDGAAGYFVGSPPSLLFRLTSFGEAKVFANLPADVPTGIARHPVTGDLIVTVFSPPELLRVSSDGSKTEVFARDRQYLAKPVAIVVDSGK